MEPLGIGFFKASRRLQSLRSPGVLKAASQVLEV